MINKDQAMERAEIEDILVKLHDGGYDPIGSIHHPIMSERTSEGNWDFYKFWEDAFSIFAEQISKEAE